jgi:hypothetical protein
VVAQLKVLNPSKNVIMFHDQDSTVDFQGADHEHIEFDLDFFSSTKGYETYVFDSGTFTLAGDGGTMNWLFMGNYLRDGDTVVFSPVYGTTRALSHIDEALTVFISRITAVRA